MHQAPAHSGSRHTTSRVDVAAIPSISETQMRMVLDVSRLLAVPTDFDDLLRLIAEAATVLLGCERASIFLHDARRNELWTKVALQSGEIRLPTGKGIAGYCFTHAELVSVADPYHDPRFNPEPDRRSGFVTRNLLTAPMLDVDGRPLGAIQAVNKLGGAGSDAGLGLATGFTEADHALIQLLAEQAGVAVQRHNLQVQALEALALRHEMDLARATQQALIPRHPPRLPWIDAWGWNCPASITGGDCWDMWELPDGRLGIFLADASGHGMGPALVVSQARTLVRALCSTEPDPHELLARVNRRLCEDLEWGRFVTAFLGFLSPDGWLHWSSAGHGPALLRADPESPLDALDPPVQPLGVIEDWMEDAPEPVRLEAGGSLALVSDGIFEAVNPAGELFGVERLKKHLHALREHPSTSTVDALCSAVRNWQGPDDPLDDQTIVLVQRTA
jgi:phosphoserine phosphatase